MSRKPDDEVIPLANILRGATDAVAAGQPTAFNSVVDEDKARLAAEDTLEFVGLDHIIAQEPEPVATPALTAAADIPSFSAVDGLARDLTTSLGEAEQRLQEIANDIASAGYHRDSLVNRIQLQLEDDIARMRENANGLIDIVNGDYHQHVAVMRGRETDNVTKADVLRALLATLKR